MRNFGIYFAMLFFAATLSSCATYDSHEARTAQSQLVGLDEESLHMCAGLPTKSENIGGMELQTYEYAPNASQLALSVPLLGSLNLGSSGYCHATFSVENSKITGVQYAGDTGGFLGHVANCSPIVTNCLDNAAIAKGN